MQAVVEPFDPPGRLDSPTGPFPDALLVRAETTGAAVAWAEANRNGLLARAGSAGVLLLRGLPLASAEDFDEFVGAFDLPNFPYDQSLSNAVRINKTPRVFTANEAPASATIRLHHEMAQTPVHPSRLFFFCELPARAGGATPVCRSDVLWSMIAAERPEFARACREKGLRYTNVMPSDDDPTSGMGRSWRSTLRAETRAEAEARLADLGYAWEWTGDGCLRATTPVLPAVKDLPDGRTVYFNQLIAAYTGWLDARNDPARAVRHGDGSRLDGEAVGFACDRAEELSYDLAWRKGDVAIIDNLVAMHGRRTFEGPRKLLASLVA